MSIDPGSPNYATADLARSTAVQDVDISKEGPNGETSGKAQVVVIAGGSGGGGSNVTVEGEGTPGTPSGGVVTVQGDPANTPVPVSVADGGDVAQGAVADAAYVSGSGTLVSVLKGIFSKLPASLGAKTSATSLSVTPATDAAFPATVSNRATYWAETTTPLAASATFNGTAREAGPASPGPSAYAYFTGFFMADQTGTASIESSPDNAAWTTVATDAVAVSTPLTLQVPITARYYRAVLVNGATLQTSLVVNSGFQSA